MPQSKAEKAATVARLAAERAKRSPEQQLEQLDRSFGEGVGAQKERARLAAQIAARDAAPTKTKRTVQSA